MTKAERTRRLRNGRKIVRLAGSGYEPQDAIADILHGYAGDDSDRANDIVESALRHFEAERLGGSE